MQGNEGMCGGCVGFPSARLVLSIMGFLGMVNCYTLRVNLSVAIVAMVNTTYLAELEASAREENDTSPHSVCAVDEVGNLTNTTKSHDDETVRAIVLSLELVMIKILLLINLTEIKR